MSKTDAVLAQRLLARDAGREHYAANREIALAAVARHCATLFPDKDQQIAFLQGFIEARANHEAFTRGK